MSHPAVHPVDVLLEPPAENAAAPPGVRMGYIKGLPGTKLGLVLRASQIFFATVAVVVMSTTSDFSSVLVFCLLVAFSGLQIFWSLAMALTNIRAISLKRKFQNRPAVIIFFAGDMISSLLMFSGACASAGITVLVNADQQDCSMNHCVQFQTSTCMAFVTWCIDLPSFMLSFWSFAAV
ncbi:hypothetical protein SOVF_123480 isoform A [Spinacia oleracea]|uniref:CASP-like protein n=1 Tax=Spinacia oleracea TaxID=3562 RepID=A0A9R0K2M1_SPIOL|nr:CASP-like protein 5A2 isoform X2 [Spinacia oleracea]KNA12711.1 hypothetical protein SOVF_123480 isoform A [Spinacia oleracea]